MTTMGERIKLFRIEKGLSQEVLAEMAGITQNAIAAIENGVTKRSKYLPQIAMALGVRLTDLDPTLGRTPATARLHDKITSLAAEARVISLALFGLSHQGVGNLHGLINAADRIESELYSLAGEVHPEKDDEEADDTVVPFAG
jgi:transcriptional regulator with XRE-family HTH domain